MTTHKTTHPGRAMPDQLLIMANLKAQRGPSGGLVLTRKFINGVAEYARYWPGPVKVLVELNEQRSSDMDHVEWLPSDLPFALEVRPTDDGALARTLSSAGVVLAFLSPAEASLAERCRSVGVPLVYYSEYSLNTERQIIDAQTRNPLLRWHRKRWVARAERKRLAALRLAAGIQCSGTPTHEVYRHVQPNALLFFDSRVRRDDVIDPEALARKTAELRQGRPLRLAFGGRLVAMKGVRQLPLVAQALQRLGVPFTLDIYGGGVLEDELRRDIAALGLQEQVALRGVLDFDTGWVPLLKNQVDLFVCCHPQGDPSSTYPEVMACGVPIAGYDNEAFVGIVKHSHAGWLSPMNEPQALAEAIARLHADRETLASACSAARQFALQHAFETTFGARVAHLLAASRLPVELKEAPGAGLGMAEGAPAFGAA